MADAEPVEKTLPEALEEVRSGIARNRKRLTYKLNPQAQPPVIQEMVLAQRHLEDAEHRLERAIKLANKPVKEEQ